MAGSTQSMRQEISKMDTSYGLLPEMPAGPAGSANTSDPDALKMFEGKDQSAPLLPAPVERRLAPADYKIFDDSSDDASWVTEYFASKANTTKGKIAEYALARNETGFFGDESLDDSIKRYFVAPDGRIAYKSPDAKIRYEFSADSFGTWLKQFSADIAAHAPTVIGESVIEATAGKFAPIKKSLLFVASHVGQVIDHRMSSGEPIVSLDTAKDIGRNMTEGLIGLGLPEGFRKLKSGELADTALLPLSDQSKDTIKDNQTFFNEQTGVDLPLDAAADRSNRSMTNLGLFLRQQPATAPMFDESDEAIKGVMEGKLDDLVESMPNQGMDPFLIGEGLRDASNMARARQIQARQEAVAAHYQRAHQNPADATDVAQLVFDLENQASRLADEFSGPMKSIIRQLTIKGDDGISYVTDSKKIHSLREMLDDKIDRGDGNIADLVQARQAVDKVLKNIDGFVDADSTFIQMTDIMMRELGDFINALSKKPDNTNYINIVNQFFSGNVTPKMVMDAKQAFQRNPEFAGLWDELVALKFGLALDKAFKNDTAATGGMNVWRNLANELAERTTTGKALRAAIGDEPERLAKFSDFVRLARLAGNTSGTTSQTQIFSQLAQILKQQGEFGIMQLTGIGSVMSLAKRYGVKVTDEAYRRMLRRIASQFLSRNGIQSWDRLTENATRAIEGTIRFPVSAPSVQAISSGIDVSGNMSGEERRMPIDEFQALQGQSYGLTQ